MSEDVEIVVPSVGESITEVFIGDWYVATGAYVPLDGRVVGLETDKATFDIPAPIGGKVTRVLKNVGETAEVGDVIGYMTAAEAPNGSPEPDAQSPRVMPGAKRMLAENNLSSSGVSGSGPGGRILKEDVARRLNDGNSKMLGSRGTKSVPLSPIRRTIAQRLVDAQQNAALLTTFNEIDMLAVKQMRSQYNVAFEKKYGIKLGFMSFFVRAVVDALQQYPAINAQLQDDQLVYHNYCDIGIAVGGGKGLVVPVLRNAESLSFADIENAIRDFAIRAQNNQLELEELKGGTFTITNGGVYGSLLSTPIVNPPQSGVLGMHGIVDRPVAINGQVVIRPMMYVALTYDHRVVDGKEAVSFLKRITEAVEDPTRLILEV
ncbi:MAG: 2-oxoglutarate dehydrogenase E2 component (dihydrolipoamide succinyltransferase) [Planctomycetaceae bacterium]|jgi:2-oxoglutarate dehydrogenase E2 component (dihydrolipoamide succinyltransferase)